MVKDANQTTDPEVTETDTQTGTLGQIFDPIPPEMLFTVNAKPQVVVSVNNIQALCPIDKCNYEIQANTPTIESYTVTDSTMVLTLTTPEGATAYTQADLSVDLGPNQCDTISAQSTSEITCTFSATL